MKQALLRSMLLLCAACRPPSVASRAPAGPDREYTRTTLPNGLVMIVAEDHTVPLVAVNVAYRVGRRDDPSGYRGLAHLAEHVTNRPADSSEGAGFVTTISNGGGRRSATTSEDRTAFVSVIPPHLLELALWVEADRMRGTPSIRPEDVERERARVESERAVRLDNPVFGSASEATLTLLFPAGHAYHEAALSADAHGEGAGPSVLAGFASRYYAPANAVVTVVGDVTTSDVLRLGQSYFAPLPGREAPARSSPPVTRADSERRAVLEDSRATAPQLRMAWLTPGGTASPAKPRFEALAAAIGPGRASPLQRALMVDRPLASRISAQHFDLEGAGIFQIDVTARAGASLSTIEDAIDSVLSSVSRDAPIRFDGAVRSALVRQWSFAQSDSARSELLSQGEMFAHDPKALLDLTSSIERVGIDGIRDAARALGKSRLVLSMVPTGRLEMAAKPELPSVNVSPAKHRSR